MRNENWTIRITRTANGREHVSERAFTGTRAEAEADAALSLRGGSATASVSPAKRPPGRPSFTGETGERYQVTIPPSIAESLRQAGDGSLSQGIIRAAAAAESVGTLHVPRAAQGQIVSRGYRARQLTSGKFGVFADEFDTSDHTWTLGRQIGRKTYGTLAEANAAAVREAE